MAVLRMGVIIVMRIALLFVLFFCNKLTAQITYYIPIDSIRIDSTVEGFEKYSIGRDSIGSDGLFYKGVSNYYNIDNSAQNFTWFTNSEYDINKRKTKSQVWKETNGIRNYYLNESFIYNDKGLKIQYSNLLSSKEQNTTWVYTDFDSLLSITSLDHDLIHKATAGEKYDYEYYNDQRIFHKIPSNLTSGVWIQQWEWTYFYGNNANIPDTLMISNSGIQYQRNLTFKNISGRDSFIVVQHKNQSTNLWTSEYSEEFWYDISGKPVLHNGWLGLPANLDFDFRETWSYNVQDQLLKNEYWYNGGGGHVTVYTYYSNGRVATYYYGNGDAMGNYEFENHYYHYIPINLPSVNTFDFLIYPNPANDNIEILINLEQKGICNIKLFNSLGQVVLSQSTELPSGNSRINIPLNTISKGLYFMGVDFGGSTVTKKLSIIK